MITIDELLMEAAKQRASDLHVTVGIPPKFRIYGELVDSAHEKMLPVDIAKMIEPLLTARIQGQLEEEGEADFSYSIPRVGRYRVNLFKQRGSYALVIRLVSTKIPEPDELGVPISVIEVTNKKRGLVLVTGPTGSGKSTTLASLINIINENQNVHIITLEDPIEYLHNHKMSVVNQREIGLDSKGYSGALRAALREDPDVILVGEMRDLDTISTAVTAAETGHLVFSTLHTTGAAATIDRIIDVFPPHQQQQIKVQLASVLETIVSQQLVPTQDGKGRAAAFEILHATPAVRNLIRENKTYQIDAVIQTNKKMGMLSMDDAIYELYLKRKIDADKAITFAQDPVALQKRLY